jgi:hypothetical protein
VVTVTVDAYGFGSYFRVGEGRDVDIVLIHHDIKEDSLEFTLRVKRLLLARMPTADVVLLSRSEQREHDFLRKCAAVFLTRLCSRTLSADIDALVVMVTNKGVERGSNPG